MTRMTKRLGLGIVGAAVVALGLASVYVSAQNSSGGPGPFMGRGRGGPGGPGPAAEVRWACWDRSAP